MSATKPTTLYDKIWNDHLVHEAEDGTCLLYIDRHLVHEVTSPQAFEGLRVAGRHPGGGSRPLSRARQGPECRGCVIHKGATARAGCAIWECGPQLLRQ